MTQEKVAGRGPRLGEEGDTRGSQSTTGPPAGRSSARGPLWRGHPRFPPRGSGQAAPAEGRRGEGGAGRGGAGTYLLSLHSFRSLTRSHLRRRKRLRRGEALGVEQLDHGVSSSLEGVISMDGSCRNSLPGARTPGRSRVSPASRLCSCTFFMRRILKRRRRSVGVDELDQSGLPSGAPWGSGTCRAGGCRFSSMLAAGMGARGGRAPSAPSASRLAPHPWPRRARPALVGKRSPLEPRGGQVPLPERREAGARPPGPNFPVRAPLAVGAGPPGPPPATAARPPSWGSRGAPACFSSALSPACLRLRLSGTRRRGAPGEGSANSQRLKIGRPGWGAGVALQGSGEQEGDGGRERERKRDTG